MIVRLSVRLARNRWRDTSADERIIDAALVRLVDEMQGQPFKFYADRVGPVVLLTAKAAA